METLAAEASKILFSQGFVGVVIFGLVLDRVLFWRRYDELRKELKECQLARIDGIEKMAQALERSTSAGLVLIEFRDKAAKMAEESSRGILTLVSLTEREHAETRKDLDEIVKEIRYLQRGGDR